MMMIFLLFYTARKSDGDSESDDEEEDAFLRQTGDYLTTSQQLPKNSLNYQKVKNANKERPSQVKMFNYIGTCIRSHKELHSKGSAMRCEICNT